MKKTFIAIKPGLARDRKHRQQMGEGLWLYLHILDIADWETGKIDGWKDPEVAHELGVSVGWVRKWRKQLASFDYIKCVNRGPKGQTVSITKWVDPRKWLRAELSESDTNATQSTQKSDTNETHSLPEGGTNGSHSANKSVANVAPLEVARMESATDLIGERDTFHSNSKISKDLLLQPVVVVGPDGRKAIYSVWEEEARTPLTQMIGDELSDMETTHGYQAVVDAIKEAVGATGPGQFGTKYVNAILQRWQREGRRAKPAPSGAGREVDPLASVGGLFEPVPE